MSKKINLLLDLDQTLISGERTKLFNRNSKHNERKKLFTYENMEDYYLIFERPGLQTFLDHIFEKYNVSIWTAASKDYALFIADKIIHRKPNRKLDFIFFSYHCDLSSDHKNGSKDLSMLWDVYKLDGYNKKNTYILDDYDEVHDTQPKNCIIAKEFEFTKKGSEDDTFLLDLIPKLQTLEDDQKDARDING